MKTYTFNALLTNNGWKKNVSVTTDKMGVITEIKSNTTDLVGEYVHGFVLPGFQNAHSHAFQYSMAGLAERHDGTGTPDDFWSWREAMYSLALSVSPPQMEAIATMLYAEMIRHGYSSVAEFHYLHHDKNGKKYNDQAEMGRRLISAAKKTGIKITLVPIFYQMGGFDKAPSKRQCRFISSDIDAYQSLFEASVVAVKDYKDANIAIGIHSMRGVAPSAIRDVVRDFPSDIPFHMHIAEQLKEVDDSLVYLNQRPVEWLLDHVDVNERFHLVHATHLSSKETVDLAKSGAKVVLCPSTEGNLGDGIFPLAKYQQNGGQWSIGTDSHIGLNPLEEFRILDYGQRLTTNKRNSFYLPPQTDSGTFAIDMALKAGRKAMNNNCNSYFEIGQSLDAVVYDADTPLLSSTSPKNISSTLVYATDATRQLGTIINGEWHSNAYGHLNLKAFQDDFVKVTNELKNR